jgi:hypothetical protein
VGGVYRVLASGSGADALAEYLAGVERTAMGLVTDPSARLAVAHRLCAIDVTIDGVRVTHGFAGRRSRDNVGD